jgi:Aldolase/RraA
MRFPVWSRAISAKGTIKATLGNVNTPVICAGACVPPGDAIIADDDGVVVPHDVVANTIVASEERIQQEDKKRARLAAGELGMDIENMRPRLEQLGLTITTILTKCQEHANEFLDILEQALETEIHVQLHVAMEQRGAGIIGDKVDFGFTAVRDIYDVLH